MAKVVATGANGFLGWHLRAALREDGIDAIGLPVGESFNLESATSQINGASRLIHIAGVNRGTDAEVGESNIFFARQMAEAIRIAEAPPAEVVYANSTQAGNGTVYGEAKARAGDVLAEAAADAGVRFSDVSLPNLFGEHGRPFYNAVTATFCHVLSNGGVPVIHRDRPLTLLHAQNAADLLSGKVPASEQARLEYTETVAGLLLRLQSISETYGRGEIPDVASGFNRDLFNTYRSYTFPQHALVQLDRHADARGSFFEIVRSHGGSSQSSFSTTEPAVSRGDHFHRRKVERFTVLAGEAMISLRKMFTSEVVTFQVTGDRPAAVDMPTLWSHKITNTGRGPLYTSFWANETFNPETPDTIVEAVRI